MFTSISLNFTFYANWCNLTSFAKTCHSRRPQTGFCRFFQGFSGVFNRRKWSGFWCQNLTQILVVFGIEIWTHFMDLVWIPESGISGYPGSPDLGLLEVRYWDTHLSITSVCPGGAHPASRGVRTTLHHLVGQSQNSYGHSIHLACSSSQSTLSHLRLSPRTLLSSVWGQVPTAERGSYEAESFCKVLLLSWGLFIMFRTPRSFFELVGSPAARRQKIDHYTSDPKFMNLGTSISGYT